MTFDNIYAIDNLYFSSKHSGGMEECIQQYNIFPCKVVDLGAGEGRNSLYLAEQGFDVISIEPSQKGTDKLEQEVERRGYNNIRIINQDFLDVTEELFDVGFLVSLTCLEHMDYSELLRSVQEIKRILRSGAYVYIVAFTEDDPGFKGDIRNASECSKFIKHYFKKNELKNLFSEFQILFYDEYLKEDLSHGKPHYHGKAKLIARKI